MHMTSADEPTILLLVWKLAETDFLSGFGKYKSAMSQNHIYDYLQCLMHSPQKSFQGLNEKIQKFKRKN